MTLSPAAIVEGDEPRVRTPEEEAGWQLARRSVLSRDGHRCVECSSPGSPEEPLHVHHLIPRSGGGLDAPSNLVALCAVCHAGKHSNMLGSLARRSIERWAVRLARLLERDLPAEVEEFGPALRLFGAGRFREGQLEIILAALRGESFLAVLPTGAGKSLCYQLPAVLSDGTAFVISPLKALMADQVQGLFDRRIPAMFINGDLSPQEKSIRYELLEQDALKLFYVAPERFNRAKLRDPAETERLVARRPSFLVVDEAHCIDRWGDDFRPDYALLGKVRERLGNPPVLAFTATAGAEMQDRILESLGVPAARRFVRDLDRQNISYARLADLPDARRGQLVARLHRRLEGRAMVFVPTVAEGTKAVAALAEAGVEALFYHGQLRPNERELILARFQGRNLPECRIVVCTNAFGMGIDLPDVRLVTHWAQPGSVEDYAQESGRAGRDGQPALALLFYKDADIGLQRFMATKAVDQNSHSESERAQLLKKKFAGIEAVAKIARQRSCVRRALSEYFGVGQKRNSSLAMRVLTFVFSRSAVMHRSGWCCDACEPKWLRNFAIKDQQLTNTIES